MGQPSWLVDAGLVLHAIQCIRRENAAGTRQIEDKYLIKVRGSNRRPCKQGLLRPEMFVESRCRWPRKQGLIEQTTLRDGRTHAEHLPCCRPAVPFVAVHQWHLVPARYLPKWPLWRLESVKIPCTSRKMTKSLSRIDCMRNGFY